MEKCQMALQRPVRRTGRSMLRVIGVAFALAVVCACGAAEEETEDETVFDPLVEAIDQAEDVQRIVDEQAEELRRRIEEAEGR